jgi:hypothetical protein
MSWTDRVVHEEALHRAKEGRNIVHEMKRMPCVETAFYKTLLKER